MKTLKLALIFCLFSLASCGEKIENMNTQAKIVTLVVEADGKDYPVAVPVSVFSLDVSLPYGTNTAMIKTLEISQGATTDKQAGDLLPVNSKTEITVNSEDKKVSNTYELTVSVAAEPNVVSTHGLLRVSGNRIVNKNNETLSLAGNSFFWSNDNWGGERYYTPEVVQWLKKDWNTTIIRAAMGVEDPGGYLESPNNNKERVKTLIDAAIAEGLYVIIDWHSHYAHLHPNEAIVFFQEMATAYGQYDHVIYEIYNEPKYIDQTPANDGKFATWDDHIKPYAEQLIAAIRAIDPDNMIVVGTGEWSQKVDDAANNPIAGYDNIAYTLHFYTVYHQQWLRDRANAAMNKGIALFITEWGSIGYTQNDPETELWMNWCKANHISHLNWAVNDKAEEWSILRQGASTTGNWPESSLTEAGKLAKTIIKEWNNN